MEAIQKAADSIVQYINECGSHSERNLVIGGDKYKPLYRALASFWCSTPLPIKDVLQDEVPTIEEAEKILVAHPFFFRCY